MPPNQNPYDFLNEQPKNRRGFNFAGESRSTRIIQIVLIAFVAIIILVVVSNFLGRDKNELQKNLRLISAQQQDLIEITKIGSEKVRNQSSNHIMTTANALIVYQQTLNNDFLKKSGAGDGKSKEVTALKDTKYKEALEKAEASGQYENTFLDIYQTRLDAYAVSLRKAYAQTGGKTQATIGEMYKNLESVSLASDEEKTN